MKTKTLKRQLRRLIRKNAKLRRDLKASKEYSHRILTDHAAYIMGKEGVRMSEKLAESLLKITPWNRLLENGEFPHNMGTVTW